MVVLGEATIKNSSVTANWRSGILASKQNEGKGVCTIGENVDCSNNTGNQPTEADYRAHAGGTFPGLPDHLVLFN